MTYVEVVAELGVNPHGSVERAKWMIDDAKQAGASFAKFQYFKVDDFMPLPEARLKMLLECEFAVDELRTLKDYAEGKGLGWFATPMKNIERIDEYMTLKPQIVKVREADSRDEKFVEHALSYHIPTIISVDPTKGPYMRPDGAWLMYCFPNDGNYVMTMDGMKEIAHVRVGDKVLTHRSRWRRVVSIMGRWYDGPIQRLKFSGFPVLTCTPNHEIFASMNHATNHKNYLKRLGALSWVEAATIKPNNFYRKDMHGHLAFSPNLPTLKQPTKLAARTYYKASSSRGSARAQQIAALARLPNSMPLSADLSYFLGLYLAEGHIADVGIGISLGMHETTLIERAQNLSLELFAVDPSIRNVPETDSTSLILCSKPLRSMFAQMFYPPNGPYDVYHKSVPNPLLPMNMDMLHGLADGDGSLDARGGIEIPSASPSLAWQALWSLPTHGYYGNLDVIPPHPTQIRGKQTFSNKMFRVRYNLNRTRIVHPLAINGCLHSARNVDAYAFVGHVYNLEVEEDNSYTINGVAVHNCNPHYPPRPQDFDVSALKHFDGFSNHFPDTLTPKLAVGSAWLWKKHFFWLELHLKNRNDDVDAPVSLDKNQFKEIADYARGLNSRMLGLE